MKKIIVLILCAMLVWALPIVASAEETEDAPVVEETVTETTTAEEAEPSFTETIAEYFQAHVADITVIGTMLMTIFYEFIQRRKLHGSIGTLNNNAVTIASDSAATIKTALAGVEEVAKVVNNYKEEFESVLSEIRKSAEEKKNLEDTLSHVETFLKTAKLATLELSNEVAELLVLANIPVSKKDELYARHIKAVHELEAVEEVTCDDNKEA